MASTAGKIHGLFRIPAGNILRQALGRQSRIGGNILRIEEPGDDHTIGLGKSFDKILLKRGPPAGGRAWFKDRPEPTTVIPGAQGGERFTNRRRMVREIVNEGDLPDDSADFLTALHPREGLHALADIVE